MSLLGVPSQDQINQIVDRATSNLSGLEQTEIQALKDLLAQEFSGLKDIEDPLLAQIQKVVDELAATRNLIQQVLMTQFVAGFQLKSPIPPDKV